MAGHEGTCWRCGTQWAPEEAPPTTLRLVRTEAPRPAAEDVPRLAVSASGTAER